MASAADDAVHTSPISGMLSTMNFIPWSIKAWSSTNNTPGFLSFISSFSEPITLTYHIRLQLNK